MKFDADTYWRKKEKPCPYAEGNKCFIVAVANYVRGLFVE